LLSLIVLPAENDNMKMSLELPAEFGSRDFKSRLDAGRNCFSLALILIRGGFSFR
jgi:hypothetical protein